MPNAATTQIVAAVVIPWTSPPLRRMVPAPRKPTPVTIWAAMRVGSTRAPKIVSIPIPVKRHAPTPTRAIVRIPAGWPCHSRSQPTAMARTRVTKRRSARSRSPCRGRSSAPSRPAGFILGAGFVRQLRQVEAVHEVPKDGQPLFVDRCFRLFLFVPGLVSVRDDAGRVHHFRRDEDRTFGAHRQSDRV